jgi:hypothetical protein
MRELKLAIATLEGGVHRRVAPAAGSKLLWRGSWDISLHPQVTFLGTRSKRGSSADRRKKTAFTRSKRHFQISDCVAILIVAPSYFRTPEFGINASWPSRGVPHLGVSARSYAHNYPHYMVRIAMNATGAMRTSPQFEISVIQFIQTGHRRGAARNLLYNLIRRG